MPINFEHQHEALPVSRDGFRANELPVTGEDLSRIAQEHGADAALQAQQVAETIRQNGGVNPNTVRFVLCETGIDHQAVLHVAANHQTWHTPSDTQTWM